MPTICNRYEGTVDQELVHGRRYMRTQQMATLFCVNNNRSIVININFYISETAQDRTEVTINH